MSRFRVKINIAFIVRTLSRFFIRPYTENILLTGVAHPGRRRHTVEYIQRKFLI